MMAQVPSMDDIHFTFRLGEYYPSQTAYNHYIHFKNVNSCIV